MATLHDSTKEEAPNKLVQGLLESESAVSSVLHRPQQQALLVSSEHEVRLALPPEQTAGLHEPRDPTCQAGARAPGGRGCRRVSARSQA